MVKIRLKRLGCKKNPVYRVVVINSSSKREGAPIAELGHYNPKSKEMKLDKATALDWMSKGAQPSETVKYLLDNCDKEGKLVYKPKTGTKLSRKAKTKLAALEAEKVQKAQEAKDAAAKAKEEAKTAKEAPAQPAAEVTPTAEPAVKAETKEETETKIVDNTDTAAASADEAAAG